MSALAECLVSTNASSNDVTINFDREYEDQEEEARFQKNAIDEIDRYRRIDEWISSYQNIYSITALDCMQKLIKANIQPLNIMDFMQYTREDTFDPLKVKAFEALVELGLLRHESILKLFLGTMASDPSPWVRNQMFTIFGKGLAAIAFGEGKTPKPSKQEVDTGLIIEQEGNTEERQKTEERTGSIAGAMDALKAEIGQNEHWKKTLWGAVT
jgi:transcription initiation factor TFIID subunit 2